MRPVCIAGPPCECLENKSSWPQIWNEIYWVLKSSGYKKHPVHAGMRYDEARKVLGDAFKPDSLPRAEAGTCRLASDTHSMIFRHGVLVDIITKKSAAKSDIGGGANHAACKD